MKRRDFLERLIISSGSALILGSTISACSKDDTPEIDIPSDGIIVDLTASANSNLLNPGGFIYQQGIIVANSGNNEFLALASTCTHEGCTVTFSLAQQKFPCPCHFSEFSYTGSVIVGPATAPLRKFNVTRDGDNLIIK